MFSNILTVCLLLFWSQDNFGTCEQSKAYEFVSENMVINFSNWSPNEFVYVDVPNRIVIEVYGHAFLEDGYFFMPWIIIWKHNHEFPLLAKQNDSFSKRFSNSSRAKRASVEISK